MTTCSGPLAQSAERGADTLAVTPHASAIVPTTRENKLYRKLERLQERALRLVYNLY